MRQWLKKIREKNQLSQTQVAKAIDITPQFYSYIENGNRRPSPQVAKRIAEVLGFAEWYRLLEPIEDSA